MNSLKTHDIASCSLDEIEKIQKLIYSITGTVINESKIYLIENRFIQHRKQFGFKNWGDYFNFLQENKDQLKQTIIDLITTTKTEFFRENIHFTLLEKILNTKNDDNEILIWSAACSRGHEVYSLDMFLNEMKTIKDFKWKILGTDINSQALRQSICGEYSHSDIHGLPESLREKYFEKLNNQKLKYTKNDRNVIKFRSFNLKYDQPFKIKFDFVFLRNVLIYFSIEDQVEIVKKLMKQMKNNGHLFIGLSENLPQIENLQYLGNSVYQKTGNPPGNLKKKKILVIDDSKTMFKIVEKTLSSSLKYEVVAHAENTVQAEEYIKKYSPDLITLDIQMPGEDGDDFYKRFISKMKIPTIVMTSLNVKESQIILNLLEMGVSDYIQKPTNNEFIHLKTQLEEKLEVAINYKDRNGPLKNKINFNIKPEKIKNNIIAIGSSTGGTVALASMIPSFPKIFPPTVIVQHIPKEFSGPFAKRINTMCPFNVVEAQDGDTLIDSTVYIAPGNRQLSIESVRGALVIRISDDPPVNRHAPSVDYFFRSLGLLKNIKVSAIILTGMGKDGALEMLNLKKLGHLTLVQDEKSSAVYGMPKAAKDIGAATEEVSLDKMTQRVFKDFI